MELLGVKENEKEKWTIKEHIPGRQKREIDVEFNF